MHKAHLPGFVKRQANKMEHLRRETGASVMLSVYEGGSVITLDQVESREGLRIVSDIGSRLPFFCTSQGKVFLAHMSRAVLEREIPAIPVAMWMEGLKVTPGLCCPGLWPGSGAAACC